MSAQPPIRVALIGSGIFVRDTYIPSIVAHYPRILLTAMLSRTMESIDQTLQQLLLASGNVGIDLHSDVLKYAGIEGEEKFFADASSVCDAVIIVVPIPLLGRYIERCLMLDIHILSEKPVAMTSGEAQRLIDLYHHRRQSDLRSSRWHVAENYRMEPAVQYASDLVSNHPISPKTFALTAIRQQTTSSKYAVTSWRSKPDYNGSFVFDGGIHFIALLRSILKGQVSVMHSVYAEQSVVEVGSCGVCKVGDAIGTYHIRYGAFPTVVCRLDVYWDDAAMSIIQHKGVGYEVMMTGMETRTFGFEGLEVEFKAWLLSIEGNGNSAPSVPQLLPEEALSDLIVVEKMCVSQSSSSSSN